MLDVRFYVRELGWWADPKIRQITSVEWIAETSDLVVSINLLDKETLQFVVVESKGVLHRDVYYGNNCVLKNVPDSGKVATLKLRGAAAAAAPEKAVPTPLPTVSLLVITKDSSPHLDLCLSQARLVNPTELVVCVNNTTKDNTAEIARKYTREVHLLDFHGHKVIEPVLNTAYDFCSSEWILRVDDDELLSSAFAELPLTLSKETLSKEETNGVCFPRYNCVDGTKRFIDVEPYYPDYQLRLFRKSAIKPHPGNVHVAQPLEGKTSTWDNFPIFHLLYQLRTYTDRVERTEYYEYPRYPTIPIRPLQIFEDYRDMWDGHIADCKHKPLVAYRSDCNNYKFRLVQIQTTSNCPARCIICGYKDSWMVKNHGTMSDELYVRILENLHQIDPLFSGQFCPYLMNDPFADKKLIERTELAFKSLYKPFIEISSNLALATLDSIKSLVRVFEDNNFRGRFVISHFGIDEDSFEYNMKLNYEVCLENMISLIKEFDGKMEIKLNNFGASRDGNMKLYSYDDIVKYFNGIVKEHSLPSANLNVPHLSFHNRAGNVKMDGWGYKRVVRSIGKEYPFDCFRIHNCLHVLWNGEVVPCCMDYNRDEVLGNLSKQRIEAVLSSEKFKNFSNRVTGLIPSATDFICCCCQSPGG